MERHDRSEIARANDDGPDQTKSNPAGNSTKLHARFSAAQFAGEFLRRAVPGPVPRHHAYTDEDGSARARMERARVHPLSPRTARVAHVPETQTTWRHCHRLHYFRSPALAPRPDSDLR